MRLDSKNHYTLRGRGWAKFQKGIYEDSIRDLSDALEFILPTENDAWQETLRGLGWSYYQEQSFKVAVEKFNRALENIDLTNKEVLRDAYRGRGSAYYKKGSLEEGNKDFEMVGISSP